MDQIDLQKGEECPRNAGAIRTALMLGAVFECNKRGDRLGERWCIVGIEGWWHTKSLPALLFLAAHGIEIDKNGSPKKLTEQKDVPHPKS